MKILRILIALILLSLIGVAAYFSVGFMQDRALENTLTDAIANSETIVMQDLTKFQWDKMYVFSAYTPEDVINETLQFNYGRSAALQDGQLTVIFTRNSKVIRHAVIPSYSESSYFLKNVQAESFSQDEAVFVKSEGEFIKK